MLQYPTIDQYGTATFCILLSQRQHRQSSCSQSSVFIVSMQLRETRAIQAKAQMLNALAGEVPRIMKAALKN